MFGKTKHRMMLLQRRLPSSLPSEATAMQAHGSVVQYAELCLTPVAVKKEEEGDTAYEPGVEEGRSKKSRGASGKRCAVSPQWIR